MYYLLRIRENEDKYIMLSKGNKYTEVSESEVQTFSKVAPDDFHFNILPEGYMIRGDILKLVTSQCSAYIEYNNEQIEVTGIGISCLKVISLEPLRIQLNGVTIKGVC